LLAVAAAMAADDSQVLYVTGEESASQVKLRAERTHTAVADLYIAAENDVSTIVGHVERLKPSLLVVDSVQTMSLAGVDGAVGGVTQVKEVAAALVRLAKSRDLAVIIVGHVTKDGAIAGPRTLEHIVDVVVSFEGDRHQGFRMIRALKNRFGPTDEVGCFDLRDEGIVEVADPTGTFTSRHTEPVPGSCLTVTLEGRRPLIAEIQALVAPSALQVPKRVAHGIDSGRLAMVLAVLQRRAGLKLHHMDVYVSTVGGARVHDSSADLAIALAVASSALDRPVSSSLVAAAEIGLAGDLRPVPGANQRLNEAERLGFRTALLAHAESRSAAQAVGVRELTTLELSTIHQALHVLDGPPSSIQPTPECHKEH
jgi:DNA repair protein RadA/Sms